jgi:hypothetical protein
MKRTLAFSVLATFAGAAMATAAPPDQTRMNPSSSDTTVRTQQAQDSVNGSMTNTDLTGNVDQDTSALTTGTTSGTTSGAIIDHTSRRPIKKKTSKKRRKHTAPKTDSRSTESGTTSGGTYGNERLNAPTTTQGRTPNDEIGLGSNGRSDTLSNDQGGATQDGGQSSTSGGGGL